MHANPSPIPTCHLQPADSLLAGLYMQPGGFPAAIASNLTRLIFKGWGQPGSYTYYAIACLRSGKSTAASPPAAIRSTWLPNRLDATVPVSNVRAQI